MCNMAIVYIHIRLDNNEVFYVGRGTDTKRMSSKSNRNKYWHNIVNKHGYRSEIIWESDADMEKNVAWGEAGKKEIEFIKKYGRKDLGEGTLVNMTDGGEGVIGKIYTEEYRKKLSESHIGIQSGNKHPLYGKGHSQETRKKISERQKGKKLSLEHRRNISIGNKGKVVSEETKLKIGMGHKGKVISEESKQKMRDAKLGKPSNRLDYFPSEEIRQKMRESHIGSRWMNDGKTQSQVMVDKIDMYLLDGWVFGRLYGHMDRLGKKHSPESIEKMKIVQRNRKRLK